jgi:hypothetical protein
MILDRLSQLQLQLQNPRIALVTTLIIILTVRYVRSPWRKVPPGPKGLPILGNALQLQNKGWMFERECKRKFGSSISVFSSDSTFTMKLSEHMMYLNVLGQPILVINSLKTAFELLDRRANIYSNRPRYIVADEILCGSLFTAFMSYGDVLVCTLF